MTDLLTRLDVRGSTRTPSEAPAPPWLVGGAAGLAAALAGLLACCGVAVAAWVAGHDGSMSSALRAGADGWLLGHGHILHVGSTTVSVIPLGLTAGAGVLSYRAGRWAARTSRAATPVDVGVFVLAYTVLYASAGVIVALAASTAAVSVSPGRGLLVTIVLAGGAAGTGAARSGPVGALLEQRLPAQVRPVLRGALGGALLLVALGALSLAASLVVHAETMQEIVHSLHPGVVGGLVLVLVCVLVLPNVLLLCVAVLLGPGISLGTATSVTLTSVSVGPLPAVPWLSAVPSSGPQPVALMALAAAPVIAGLAAGALTVPCLPPSGYDRAALWGGAAGAAGGLLVAFALALSGGSVGPDRMAQIGPQLLACAAVAVATLGVGGVLGGLGSRLLLGRRG